MYNDFFSLARYINKKGIGYFLYAPSLEDISCFEGILFKNGIADLNEIERIANLVH